MRQTSARRPAAGRQVAERRRGPYVIRDGATVLVVPPLAGRGGEVAVGELLMWLDATHRAAARRRRAIFRAAFQRWIEEERPLADLVHAGFADLDRFLRETH
jgi:hypothetical protein